VTRAVIAQSVRILRQNSLLAEQYAWAAHLQGLHLKAAMYDREADRLWERSDAVAAAEVVDAMEVQPC